MYLCLVNYFIIAIAEHIFIFLASRRQSFKILTITLLSSVMAWIERSPWPAFSPCLMKSIRYDHIFSPVKSCKPSLWILQWKDNSWSWLTMKSTCVIVKPMWAILVSIFSSTLSVMHQLWLQVSWLDSVNKLLLYTHILPRIQIYWSSTHNKCN